MGMSSSRHPEKETHINMNSVVVVLDAIIVATINLIQFIGSAWNESKNCFPRRPVMQIRR